MPSKYERLIRDYCMRHGVDVPIGFGRHAPGHYAIVRTHPDPPKLVALTWSKVADVVYYVDHFLRPELGEGLGRAIRIFDFKAGEELAYAGGGRLDRIGPIAPTDAATDPVAPGPDRVAERAARGSRAAYDRVLDKVPVAPPEPGDER